jgi:hypothetical protein
VPSTTQYDASSAMPFGSVKYTERMKPWSTTEVTAPGLEESLRAARARPRRARRTRCGRAGWRDRWPRGLGELSAPVTEEGDGVPAAHPKK